MTLSYTGVTVGALLTVELILLASTAIVVALLLNSGVIQTELIKAFARDALTMIPPNQSVTYFRDFNGSTGRSGRREVERKSNLGNFLIVSMDGQLFYTDGQSLHHIQCEWKGDFGPDNTDVVLKLPITWKTLPKLALVVEDSVRD